VTSDVTSVVSNIISMPTFNVMADTFMFDDSQLSLAAAANLAMLANESVPDNPEELNITTNSRRNQAEQDAATVEVNARAPAADEAHATPLPICH
jgi:hypothetical protein